MNLTHRQPDPTPRRLLQRLLATVMLPLALMGTPAVAWAQTPAQGEAAVSTGGPIRLRQPAQADATAGRDSLDGRQPAAKAPAVAAAAAALSDFETYVRKQPGGADIRRLGL